MTATRLAASAALALAIGVLTGRLCAQSATSGGPSLTVWLDPRGDDENSGLSPASPVLSLTRAHGILETALTTRARDAEVRIRPGIYHHQRVEWRFTMADHTITLRTSADDSTRPVFDGSDVGGTWFTLKQAPGRKTNLAFDRIHVRNYGMAILLHADREDPDGWNGGNSVVDCVFDSVGESSDAVIDLVNSRENRFEGNTFTNITRSDGRCYLLHTIYLASMSSGNEIIGNRFENSCGPPIRVRDASNDNRVAGNVFRRVGIEAAYTQWFCDHDVRSGCTKRGPECPSWNNVFENNVLDGNSRGERLKPWILMTPDSTEDGCAHPSPTKRCAPPSADACRVRGEGNVAPEGH